MSLGNYYLQFSSQLLNPSNQDFSWEHIKQTLSPLLDFKGILFVQDLGCLARGGRISEFKSLIGQILKVKILINYGDGKLNFYSKQISIKRCLSKLVKYVHDELGVSADEPCHLKL